MLVKLLVLHLNFFYWSLLKVRVTITARCNLLQILEDWVHMQGQVVRIYARPVAEVSDSLVRVPAHIVYTLQRVLVGVLHWILKLRRLVAVGEAHHLVHVGVLVKLQKLLRLGSES